MSAKMPDHISQMILDFRSKAQEAVTKLSETHHPMDRVHLVAEANIYRQCADRLESWQGDITKFHGMEDLWGHFSSEQLVREFNSRFPTTLKAHLGHLEITERLRKQAKEDA